MSELAPHMRPERSFQGLILGQAVANGVNLRTVGDDRIGITVDERTRPDMSSSADRPAAVHGRVGEACPVCGVVVRAVSFADRSLQYCATCQTGGKPLADRRMSKLLK